MTALSIQAAERRGLLSVRADTPPSTQDIRIAIASIEKLIEDFKTENDKRISALEKGKADVLTDEKVDTMNAQITVLEEGLNKAMADAQKAVLVNNPVTAEDAAKAQQSALQFFASLDQVEPGEGPSPEQIEAHASYRKAYLRALRHPEWTNGLAGDFRAEMSIGSQKDGGYLAPGQMLDIMKRRLFDTSDVRSVATVIETSRSHVSFPIDVDDAETGGWVSERGARPGNTGTPEIGEQRINLHEQYAEPRLTQALLDNAAVDVEGWVGNKTADKFSRVENTAFVNGNGVGKPKGFMSYTADAVTEDDAARDWGVLQYVPTGAADSFPDLASGSIGKSADPLIDLITKLKPAYRRNARWAMARGTEAEIRKLKDNEGRYYADFVRLSNGAFGFALLNYEIRTMEDMPAFGAGAFPIAFGDFGESYMIIDGMGMRTLRDPFTTKGWVKFYSTKHVGGDVVNFDALKFMKVGTS